MSSAPAPSVICFGAFELDAATGELRKSGISIRIHPQPFRVLILLTERPGQIVTRNEIQHCLWSDSTFVDYERGINFCINQIRGALGDDADTPRYIETLPRRGYRFIAAVSPACAWRPNLVVPKRDDLAHVANGNGHVLASLNDAAPCLAAIEEDSVPKNSNVLWRRLLLGTELAIFVLALSLGWRWFRHQHTAPSVALSERQLTHNPPENRNLGDAISPDGKHVAFIDVKGLHLLAIDTGELHDIALPQAMVSKLWAVQWFSDGENLLLRTATEAEGNVLWLVSVFGGSPRKLREHAWPAATSPESLSIAFITGQLNELWVMEASGDTLKKVLTSDGRLGNVAWSPTGRRLAFIRNSNATETQTKRSIETVSLDGGPPSIVFTDVHLSREVLCWMNDGRLIFSRDEPRQIDAANLWQIAADPKTGNPTGKPAKITNWYGVEPVDVSASKDGRRLVVDKFQNRNDVYIGDLNETGTRLDAPRRLTFSESRDVPSVWTRDGKAVLFSSNRTGRSQIFSQQLGKDGADPLVPSSDEQISALTTPDGRWILYYSTLYAENDAPPTTRLMRLASSSGAIPEQVLQVQGVPGLATFVFDCPRESPGSCVISRSNQGRLVFYALDPVQGQGRQIATTKFEQTNVEDWAVSPDGSRIAVANANQPGKQITILDLGNGAERNIPLPPEWRVYSLAWAKQRNAFFAAVAGPHYQIVRIGLDGRTSLLLDRARDTWLSNVVPSVDGLHLAFNQQTFEANVWLLESF
jgi:DNA-binding winged helix-turn-helix (wHTH) protein/Tol biopolymer transport system component